MGDPTSFVYRRNEHFELYENLLLDRGAHHLKFGTYFFHLRFRPEQPDKALAQIDKSLALDPKHPATLLNQGIIRAFGKQDLPGALESWQKVVQYAPNSPEAARAKEGIDGLQSAHGKNGPGGGGRGGL